MVRWAGWCRTGGFQTVKSFFDKLTSNFIGWYFLSRHMLGLILRSRLKIWFLGVAACVTFQLIGIMYSLCIMKAIHKLAFHLKN